MLLEMFEPALCLVGITAFAGLMIWVGVENVRDTCRYFMFHMDLELKEERWMAKMAGG